jgi:hypothetical protein
MTDREKEISLGGNIFRVVQGPRRADLERYPGRIVTGNLINSDEVRAPSWVVSDLSGGQGIFLMDPNTHPDRYWFGVGEFRSSHFGLPPYAHDAGGGDYSLLAEFGETVYGFDTHAWEFDATLETWTDKGAIAGQALSWIEYKGKLYVACGTSGYSYSSDGETWADVADQAISFTIYDGKLIKLDSSGVVAYSTDGTTWTTLLTLDHPAGYYQHLFIYFNFSDEDCIYVAHKKGFDWIDFTNAQAHSAGLTLPKHPYGGKASGTWRGDYAVYAAGLAMYAFYPGTVRSVGLDRNDGVPANMRGNIIDLAGSHYALFVALDNTSAGVAVQTSRSTRWHFLAPKVLAPSTGFSYILDFTGAAWRATWQSGDQSSPIRCLLVSDASSYRLWWVADGHVWYRKLPLGVVDPYMSPDSEYGESTTLITSWFYGTSLVDYKAALQLSMTTEGAANGTITVSYAINGSESWTQIGQYTSDNIPDYAFNSGAGLEFERIRFKVDITRTSTDITAGIWVTAMKLRYRHALPKLRSWSVTVDCTSEYGGLQPRQQLALLSSYSSSHVLVPLIFEYPPVTYWVDVNIQGEENTGRLRKGRYTLVLSECV